MFSQTLSSPLFPFDSAAAFSAGMLWQCLFAFCPSGCAVPSDDS